MKLKNVYDDGTISIRRSISPPAWNLTVRSAAMCLPVLDNGRFLLIKEQKQSTGKWVTGFPGGMIENGENAKQAAQRECEEELGLRPSRLKKITEVHSTFPTTSVTYFLGRNLKKGEMKPWGEVHSTQEVTLNQLFSIALNAEFTDPRLTVAMLQMRKLVKNGKLSIT